MNKPKTSVDPPITLIDTPNAAAPHLDRLNADQRSAVLHRHKDSHQPLLIIAGAGTGKTNTLVHRLAHLVLVKAAIFARAETGTCTRAGPG